MGRLYAEGRGVYRDAGRAAEWFAKAAAQRSASGMIGLGILHFHGSGVVHDNVAALKWFLAAREAAASSPDGLPVRVYDAEIRSPQVWIALAERPLDHAQAEKARQGARELLTAEIGRAHV